MTQEPESVQLLHSTTLAQKVQPVGTMSNGEMLRSLKDTRETSNSRLNLTGAAISVGKERSRNGVSLIMSYTCPCFTSIAAVHDERLGRNEKQHWKRSTAL